MSDDIIAAIDTALGCQWCGGDLEGSPSIDFCGDRCQSAWHLARSEPLIGYREPEDLAAHVSNRQEEFNPETSGESGLLFPAWVRDETARMFDQMPRWDTRQPEVLAHYTVTADSIAANVAVSESMLHSNAVNAGVELGRHFSQALRSIEPAFERLGEAVRTPMGALQQAYGVDKPPTDPRERALWLRQNRNTGPPVGPPNPRSINARGARAAASRQCNGRRRRRTP